MKQNLIERNFGADVLRIVSILAVIAQHLTPSVLDSNISVTSFDWKFTNIYLGFIVWAVPVFMMISGSFLLRKDIPVKLIFTKYIFKLVIALFFWSLFYELIYYIQEGKSFTIFSIIGPLVWKRLPWYHLWFIYAIIGVYVLIPIIRIFIKSATQRNIEYFLFLFVLVTAIRYFNVSFSNKLNFNIVEMSGYVGYFVLGYYLAVYRLKKTTKLSLLVLSVIFTLISIYQTYSYKLLFDIRTMDFYSNLGLSTLLLSTIVFIFVNQYFNSIEVSSKVRKTVGYVSQCTFGIYLVHDIVLRLVMKCKTYLMNVDVVSSMFTLTFLIFILSLLVIIVIRKIPYFGTKIV